MPTAQTLLFASVFILTLEEDFKLVSSVGDAVKNDIVVSWENFIFFFFFFLHLLFSLSMSGLFCLGKIRSDPFLKFIVIPLSQCWKVQFIYLLFFF